MHKPILLMLTLVVPIYGICGSIPEGSAEMLPAQGAIGLIDSSRQMLVISDRVYYLTGTTQVEAKDGSRLPTSTLAVGQRIGFDYLTNDRKRRLLTRIRLTPQESSSP